MTMMIVTQIDFLKNHLLLCVDRAATYWCTSIVIVLFLLDSISLVFCVVIATFNVLFMHMWLRMHVMM